MKFLHLAILMLTGVASCNVFADQVKREFDYGGTKRSYLIYLPSSYQKDKPAPLLLALHGKTSNGQRMAVLTGFNARAERHGFVVVYPEGIDRQWNYLHGISGYREEPRDSDFLLEIVDAVTNEYNIDNRRVFVTGISNGGFMAQRLACYAPKKFAAFASVAAGGYGAMSVECKNDVPVSMLYVHGTADTKVPWKGLGIQDDKGNRQLVTMSLANSVKFWSGRNRCSPTVVSREITPLSNSPATRVKVLSSGQCPGGAEIVLYAVIGGGHNWPGAADIIPASIAGRVNMDIHASDVIWSFFSTRRLD